LGVDQEHKTRLHQLSQDITDPTSRRRHRLD
jgi:hypothetical protein